VSILQYETEQSGAVKIQGDTKVENEAEKEMQVKRRLLEE
jgi:hypothetical protein